MFSCSELCQKCLEGEIKSETNQNLERRDEPDLRVQATQNPATHWEVQPWQVTQHLGGGVLAAALSQDLPSDGAVFAWLWSGFQVHTPGPPE